jgi:hypothetical protein
VRRHLLIFYQLIERLSINSVHQEPPIFLPLESFWANEAIFQLMMLACNADGYIRLFLLFKMDFVGETEYRQQIKTFRLKYIFLAGKIIRTARSVVMKLSEKYPYQEIYEKSLS